MAKLVWDQIGERFYETGVDRGVLYLPDSGGLYSTGFAWNGLTAVTESPSGAEPNAQYADNIKYLNLISLEEFGGTIEAFTYPDAFAQCDGSAEPKLGVFVGQQPRKPFGLAYRTRLGNDLVNDAYGYKLHLIYGASAQPSERAYSTINDSPEAMTFSWEFSTTPLPVEGHKPTASLTIDASKVDAAALATLEGFLYGTVGTSPSLPSPDEVIQLFNAAAVTVTPTKPTQSANNVTIPTVTGVTYRVNGKPVSGILALTENVVVTATPNKGYVFPPVTDDDWLFIKT